MIPALEGALGVCLVGAAIVTANRQTMATHWTKRYWNVGVGVMALWLVLSVALSFAPVARDAHAVVTYDFPGQLHVRMSAVKVRDCQHKQTDAYVVDTAGNLHEATLVWEGDRIAGNSRPTGRHVWEPARVEYDPSVQVAQVEFISTHSCGWMWHDTTTRAGPWGVPMR